MKGLWMTHIIKQCPGSAAQNLGWPHRVVLLPYAALYAPDHVHPRRPQAGHAAAAAAGAGGRRMRRQRARPVPQHPRHLRGVDSGYAHSARALRRSVRRVRRCGAGERAKAALCAGRLKACRCRGTQGSSGAEGCLTAGQRRWAHVWDHLRPGSLERPTSAHAGRRLSTCVRHGSAHACE